MQIDELGNREWFPLLPAIDGEPYEQLIERSRKAYQEQKERDRAASERMMARDSGMQLRSRLGHSGNVGHARRRVPRPATAGKWSGQSTAEMAFLAFLVIMLVIVLLATDVI